jgi:4-amino-4-deoxy-L-arabinose transferase-like glycosyltransferase
LKTGGRRFSAVVGFVLAIGAAWAFSSERVGLGEAAAILAIVAFAVGELATGARDSAMPKPVETAVEDERGGALPPSTPDPFEAAGVAEPATAAEPASVDEDAARARDEVTLADAVARPTPTRGMPWLFALLVVCTVFFRTYRLDSIPWGINTDVGWNGTFALRFLHGEPYTPYTEEAWGKETLFFYMIAGVFKVFGVDGTTLRVPALIAGTLTVLVFYGLSRDLFDRRLATIAAFVYSAMAWHVTLSRTGYRAILAPLAMVLVLWLFYRAIDARSARRRLAYFAGTGLAIGFGLNTYFSFRVVPPLLVILAVHAGWKQSGYLRRNAAGFALLLACSIVVVLPLALYAMAHPDVFFARTGYLWIGNRMREAGSWDPFWENLRNNLLMFHYKAKVGNFFDNEWPILSRPLGVFFLAGLGVFLGRCRERGPLLALLVAVFGHVPAMLSMPDATRSLLVTAAVAWCAAAGVEAVLRLLPRGTTLAAVLLTVGIMAAEYRFYFVDLAQSGWAQFGYAGPQTAIAREVVKLTRDHQTFLCRTHNYYTVQFLLHDVPPERLMGVGSETADDLSEERLMALLDEALTQPRPVGLGLAFVIDNQPKNQALLERVRGLFPQAAVIPHGDPRFGEPFFTVVIAAPPGPARPPSP